MTKDGRSRQSSSTSRALLLQGQLSPPTLGGDKQVGQSSLLSPPITCAGVVWLLRHQDALEGETERDTVKLLHAAPRLSPNMRGRCEVSAKLTCALQNVPLTLAKDIRRSFEKIFPVIWDKNG